jgi:hypothetical protein
LWLNSEYVLQKQKSIHERKHIHKPYNKRQRIILVIKEKKAEVNISSTRN